MTDRQICLFLAKAFLGFAVSYALVVGWLA